MFGKGRHMDNHQILREVQLMVQECFHGYNGFICTYMYKEILLLKMEYVLLDMQFVVSQNFCCACIHLEIIYHCSTIFIFGLSFHLSILLTVSQ